jgi:hypothetical protein
VTPYGVEAGEVLLMLDELVDQFIRMIPPETGMVVDGQQMEVVRSVLSLVLGSEILQVPAEDAERTVRAAEVWQSSMELRRLPLSVLQCKLFFKAYIQTHFFTSLE